MTQTETLKAGLRAYKKKYYQNILLRGSIFLLLWLSGTFLLANSIEFALRLDTLGRAILLAGFLAVSLYALSRYVLHPLYILLNNQKQISDEEAAKQIGQYFPEVKDKLLNVLQLSSLPNASEDLIKAGIEQKTKEISFVPFSSAIDFSVNLKYARLLAVPLGVLLIILIAIPSFVTESTTRIINYSKVYIPEAPFRFNILNSQLQAFKNEDFTLRIELEGNAIPDAAYLIVNDRRIKMKSEPNDVFVHTFTRVQNNFRFQIEAAGFESGVYQLEVLRRPSLGSMDITLIYPRYLRMEPERFRNSGNLRIPEGTQIAWEVEAMDTDHVEFLFETDQERLRADKKGRDKFAISRIFQNSDQYQIELNNQQSANSDPITYRIDVVKDMHPEINIRQFVDTTLYAYIIFGGSISDDYGLSDLKLYLKRDGDEKFSSIAVPFNPESKEQNIYYRFETDSLQLGRGSSLEYFLEVTDNDGVNGRKASRTPVFKMSIPDEKETREILERTAENTQKEIDSAGKQAKEVKDQVEEIERRLKGKKTLDWQDQKMIEDLFNKREKLENQIQQMRMQAEETEQLFERFGSNNEKLKEKIEMIQKLMEELLDEETKRLYKELQRLLDEKRDMNQINRVMEQLSRQENNLEKELDRTLELFKRLQYEMKAEQNLARIEDLQKQLEELKEKMDDPNQANDQLAEEQKALVEEFEELRKDMEEMREMNQELRAPDNLQETEDLENQISEDMQKSLDNLEQNNRQNSKQNQQKAGENLKQLGKMLESMMESAESEMMEENIAALQRVMHNMVKLSMDQEELIKSFRDVNSSDPRFMDLAKNQLDLKINSKVLQDSLQALSMRIFELSSFINRELNELNDHFDETLFQLKERRKTQAIARQEFAMTSINNLALMLDNLLDQLQNPPQGGSGKSGKSKKGNRPNMSELQKRLSEQIEELKQSGTQGRELSEQLSKMAAEQEQLRRMMQEMSEQTIDGDLAQEIREIMEQMEQNELDLVNKNLSDQLIERQNEINTRLLKAENAMREKENEEEREGEQAKSFEKPAPKIFEEYLKTKEKEIELLRTIPPRLTPYYRMEVNEYFKRINN
jgi:hypothetical protein